MNNLSYTLIAENPTNNYLKIVVELTPKPQNVQTNFQLPAWRPGRYTLQNFVKNVRNVQFAAENGEILAAEKITKDCWKVSHQDGQKIRLTYEYYARQWDAGGCWFDDEQVYVNWVCCAMYAVGYENEAFEVQLNIPSEYKIACSLPQNGNTLSVQNFDELADSPMLASANLQHHSYQIEESDCNFHLWVQGNHTPDWEKWLSDFSAFSRTQLQLFGDIPTKDFHFLILLLPHTFYHGVEHLKSTVIALGPADKMSEKSMYDELLGVSCHELFHVWNIKSIRPQEMMPYIFSEENYFRTGFVAEGITTYYGDYLLLRSGIFETDEYFREFNKMLKRWHDNYGRHNLSVADSSFDLWIDGYEAGVPHRKRSIYVDGCMGALIFDLTIRKNSKNERSLDDLMRLLWENFGKKGIGYTEKDYIEAAEMLAGADLTEYFDEVIFGKADLTTWLNEALAWLGCELVKEAGKESSEANFGLRFAGTSVAMTAPNSPAESVLSIGDELLAINGLKATSENIQRLFAEKEKLTCHFFRNGRLLQADLQRDGQVYFEKVTINVLEEITEAQRLNFEIWAGL
jgi:predicted metalloprotease with PDZ domain